MSMTTANIKTECVGGRIRDVDWKPLFIRCVSAAVFSCALLALCGCDNPDKTAGDYLNLRNSFLDPSQVGRFDMEHPYGYVSPVTWPILDSLAVDDPPDHPWANSELPTPADLVPSTAQYILSAGDVITVSVYELITPGEESAQTREINTDGDVTLDFVGKVHAAGLTADQLRDKVTQILIRNGTMTPPGPHQPGPQVNVDLTDAHKQVFSIIGTATHPGTYNISAPDFRLLDALALSGDLPVQPGMDWLYIIRSVPVAHEPQTTTNSTGQQNQAGTTSSSSILADIANQLGQQSSSSNSSTTPPGSGEGQNLPNQTTESPSSKATGTHFIYTNGAWVQVSNDGGSETPATSPQSATASVSSGPMLYNFANAVRPAQQPLYINQRVIRIPMAALRDGDPRYNIVIMPGDIINIPEVDPTYFYIMGNVNRPGVYSLTGQKITLKMAVAAAGNLGPIAIPRRAELIRRIGNNQEMIIQVNLQMIFDGEEPDIFLKPDDVLNVGTDAFAAALATVRNGFQAAYGFGFTYDRNYYITPTIIGN